MLSTQYMESWTVESIVCAPLNMYGQLRMKVKHAMRESTSDQILPHIAHKSDIVGVSVIDLRTIHPKDGDLIGGTRSSIVVMVS